VEIITRGSAYALKANPLSVDVCRFRAVVAGARAESDDARKVVLFRRALKMWHGPPLADVAAPEVVHQLCHGLEEARLAAWEECLEAELRLGRHNAVIDELTDLVTQHPFRQRPLALHMLALYRGGRAPEALGAYTVTRSRLMDELAVDPEPQLRQLHSAILCADPALDLPRTRHDARTVSLALPADVWSFPEFAVRPPAEAAVKQPEPRSTTDMVTLEARGLTKLFGSRTAVDGVSFSACRGEVVCLLGPNGAGKTTTIRLLSTVLTPTSGEFSVAGVPFTRPAEIRRRVGVLPESAGYPGQQTGIEFLRYHARLFGAPRTEALRVAEDLLAEVGLHERARSRISTYSHGMRQRLGIARALVNDPAVVLLDEPTLGLDTADQRHVLAIVREIALNRGVTVVLSTRALPDGEETCSSVLILDNGKVRIGGQGSHVRTPRRLRRR
jgi:ABC-2 type transport system ATP-binding protein